MCNLFRNNAFFLERFVLFLGMVALLCFFASVPAETTALNDQDIYVEVIILEHSSAAPPARHYPPSEMPGGDATEGVLLYLHSSENGITSVIGNVHPRLNSSRHSMWAEIKKLTSSHSPFSVLDVISWRQPIYQSRHAPVIELLNTPGSVLLSVKVRVSFDRYFNFELGLSSRNRSASAPEISEQAEVLTDKVYFRATLDFDEIHYLDHPKFGVIVQIQPAAVYSEGKDADGEAANRVREDRGERPPALPVDEVQSIEIEKDLPDDALLQDEQGQN